MGETQHITDLLAVAIGAAAGALAASRKQMDIGGFALIAMITGVGGGTVRDLVLNVPVFWLRDGSFILVALAVAVALFFGAHLLESRWKWLLWADAVALGLYAVAGTAKAIQADANYVVAAGLGVVTATFGGVLRDVLCAEVPLILRKEIYATAAAAGASLYALLVWLGVAPPYALAVGFAVGFGVRAIALAFNYSLPPYKARPGRPF
jgi:uncharacterized membrane protein YeiH